MERQCVGEEEQDSVCDLINLAYLCFVIAIFKSVCIQVLYPPPKPVSLPTACTETYPHYINVAFSHSLNQKEPVRNPIG